MRSLAGNLPIFLIFALFIVSHNLRKLDPPLVTSIKIRGAFRSIFSSLRLGDRLSQENDLNFFSARETDPLYAVTFFPFYN